MQTPWTASSGENSSASSALQLLRRIPTKHRLIISALAVWGVAIFVHRIAKHSATQSQASTQPTTATTAPQVQTAVASAPAFSATQRPAQQTQPPPSARKRFITLPSNAKLIVNNASGQPLSELDVRNPLIFAFHVQVATGNNLQLQINVHPGREIRETALTFDELKDALVATQAGHIRPGQQLRVATQPLFNPSVRLLDLIQKSAIGYAWFFEKVSDQAVFGEVTSFRGTTERPAADLQFEGRVQSAFPGGRWTAIGVSAEGAHAFKENGRWNLAQDRPDDPKRLAEERALVLQIVKDIDAGVFEFDPAAVSETRDFPNIAGEVKLIRSSGQVATADLSQEEIPQLKAKAENGDAAAQVRLGRAYLKGNGVEADASEAIKWFRKAAEQNNSEAQVYLAYCYDGGGPEENLAEAIKWYRRAADLNNASAQFNLAACFEFGRGVEKNAEEAARLYRRAADQNNAEAQASLGLCYALGQGVPKNMTEAINWWSKAAQQKNPRAQYNIGASFQNGLTGKPDLAAAAIWYRLAAEQGHPQAIQALAQLPQEVAPDPNLTLIQEAKRQAEIAFFQHWSRTENDTYVYRAKNGTTYEASKVMMQSFVDDLKESDRLNGLEFKAKFLHTPSAFRSSKNGKVSEWMQGGFDYRNPFPTTPIVSPQTTTFVEKRSGRWSARVVLPDNIEDVSENFRFLQRVLDDADLNKPQRDGFNKMVDDLNGTRDFRNQIKVPRPAGPNQ